VYEKKRIKETCAYGKRRMMECKAHIKQIFVRKEAYKVEICVRKETHNRLRHSVMRVFSYTYVCCMGISVDRLTFEK